MSLFSAQNSSSVIGVTPMYSVSLLPAPRTQSAASTLMPASLTTAPLTSWIPTTIARSLEQACSDTAYVAKALVRRPVPFDVKAHRISGFACRDVDATASRFTTTKQTAQCDRFAGDDAGRSGADVHRIGVHHPRHDLVVGVDVGAGMSLSGPMISPISLV